MSDQGEREIQERQREGKEREGWEGREGWKMIDLSVLCDSL